MSCHVMMVYPSTYLVLLPELPADRAELGPQHPAHHDGQPAQRALSLSFIDCLGIDVRLDDLGLSCVRS